MDDADLPFDQVFAGGSDTFRQLLENAVSSKESFANQTIEIAKKDAQPQAFSATLNLCRNRMGRLSHIVVILKQASPPPAQAS